MEFFFNYTSQQNIISKHVIPGCYIYRNKIKTYGIFGRSWHVFIDRCCCLKLLITHTNRTRACVSCQNFSKILVLHPSSVYGTASYWKYSRVNSYANQSRICMETIRPIRILYARHNIHIARDKTYNISIVSPSYRISFHCNLHVPSLFVESSRYTYTSHIHVFMPAEKHNPGVS